MDKANIAEVLNGSNNDKFVTPRTLSKKLELFSIIKNMYGSFDINKLTWGNSDTINDYTGDINDLLTSGWFATGSANTNLPSGTQYLILVMVKNPTYYVKQIAFERNGHTMWMRYKVDANTWSSWVKLLEASASSINDVFGVSNLMGRTYVGTGKNINDYKTAGQYAFYGSNTNSPPISAISILEVMQYSNDWVLQRWTSIETGNMWERRFTGGTTWTAWVQRW